MDLHINYFLLTLKFPALNNPYSLPPPITACRPAFLPSRCRPVLAKIRTSVFRRLFQIPCIFLTSMLHRVRAALFYSFSEFFSYFNVYSLFFFLSINRLLFAHIVPLWRLSCFLFFDFVIFNSLFYFFYILIFFLKFKFHLYFPCSHSSFLHSFLFDYCFSPIINFPFFVYILLVFPTIFEY